jgi:hypothetical protein
MSRINSQVDFEPPFRGLILYLKYNIYVWIGLALFFGQAYVLIFWIFSLKFAAFFPTVAKHRGVNAFISIHL